MSAALEVPPDSLFFAAIPDISSTLSADDVTFVSACYYLIRAIFSFTTLMSGAGVETPVLTTFEEHRDYFTSLYSEGFPDGTYTLTSKTIGLYYVYSRERQVLSCCVGIYKIYTTGDPVFEVWGVASNPYYQRSGATKFLLANIIKASYQSVFPFVVNYKIRLEVARDSFPYITFYDRLLMYYKHGFEVVPALTAPTAPILTDEGVGSLNLSEITISYRFNVDGPIGTYNDQEFPISNFKTYIPLLYSPSDPVYMEHKAHIISAVTSKTTIELLKLSEPKMLSDILPTKFLYTLYHSNYVVDPETNLIRSRKLPPNVELVIMNTPGYYTYHDIVSLNWLFAQTVLSEMSIEKLGLVFRGMKSSLTGEIPSPLIGNNSIPYIQSIENNLLFRFTYHTTRPVLHFHCYKPGDYYPELVLTVGEPSPTGTDFAALMYGVYDIPKGETNAMAERVRDDYYAALSDEATFDGNNWLPDHTRHLQKDKFRGRHVNLSDLITDIVTEYDEGNNAPVEPHPENRIRIYVFSCGNVYPPGYDEAFQAATQSYAGRIVDVSSRDEYETALDHIGQTLDISFGHNIPVAAAGGAGAASAGGRRRRKWKTYRARRTRKSKA